MAGETTTTALSNQIERINSEWDGYRKEFISGFISELPDEERLAWEAEYLESLSGPLRQLWLKKADWVGRGTLSNAEQFIERKTGKTCLDREEWAEQKGKPNPNKLAEERDRLL